MKILSILLALTFSSNSFAYTQCINWDEQRNECTQEMSLVDEGSFNALAKEVAKQTQTMAQNEKRLKSEMIKLIADARKQIVVDLLNDPEMREIIKEKIRALEAK